MPLPAALLAAGGNVSPSVASFPMRVIYGVHKEHVHRWMRVALGNKPWAVVERCYCGSTRRACQFFGIEIHNQPDDVWGG